MLPARLASAALACPTGGFLGRGRLRRSSMKKPRRRGGLGAPSGPMGGPVMGRENPSRPLAYHSKPPCQFGMPAVSACNWGYLGCVTLPACLALNWSGAGGSIV